MIYENERIDIVNDSISLIQKPDGLTFGTDALLLAGYIHGNFKKGAELGGGSGIISMLAVTRGKIESCQAIEVQEEYADLISRNAELNSLRDKLSAYCSDIRLLPVSEDCDVVFTNPPYMKADGGRLNKTDAKTIARHEIHGDITDFAVAGKKLLKYGGAFYAVYRPDRLTDIIYALRENGLEPKRVTFVHADKDSESSMVLIEAKRGGKSGMHLTKPLIIYSDNAHEKYGADMEYIMEFGRFPPEYKR